MNINKSFSVGLPFMKLSLNPSMQKHNGKAAKTCSVGSAWDEMNDKRKGRDKTIDRTLTENNVWLIGDTNIEMEAVIQAEIDRVTAERKEHGKRGLRKDVVSAVEMIEKPPMDIMSDLTREEQLELLRISNEVFEELIHEWAPEWKTQAAVIHFDEFGGKAPHTHRIVTMTARDEDGILTMNAKRDFNLNFFTFINKNYSERMNERGIPVKECNLFKEMSIDEQLIHKDQRKEYGVDAVTYKMRKSEELDKDIEDKENQIEKIKEEKAALDSAIENLNIKKDAAEADVQKLNEVRKSYRFGLEEFDPDKWMIPEPGMFETAPKYKKDKAEPLIKKLLGKLKKLTKKYNNCRNELMECQKENNNLNKMCERESRQRLDLQLKSSSLAEAVLSLKAKVNEFELVKKVLGNDKVAELVESGRKMENIERQQKERERQIRRSRNRGMSL